MRVVPSTSLERWLPIECPIPVDMTRRSPVTLNALLDALHVTDNPRYQPITLSPNMVTTWCNIFTWDVTRCMGAEVPHWIASHEQTANDMVDWLDAVGPMQGWRQVGPREAQSAANMGSPVVAGWQSPPGKIGHVAIVTPADIPEKFISPSICNVGARNFRRGKSTEGFGARDVRYWGHL